MRTPWRLTCAAIRKAFLRWDTTPPEPPPPRFGIRSFAWRMKINCDLKERGLEVEVSNLAERAGLGGRLIFSGSFDVAALTCRPDLLKIADVYLDVEGYVPNLYWNYRDIPDFDLEAADRICEACLAAGIQTANIYHGLVTRRFIEFLSRKGIGVSAWTVDESEALEWFFQRGVQNVTTRRIASALALRREGR